MRPDRVWCNTKNPEVIKLLRGMLTVPCHISLMNVQVALLLDIIVSFAQLCLLLRYDCSDICG